MSYQPQRVCARTCALWQRGIPLPGVFCWYSYSGRMPLTGRLMCRLCGRDA